LFRKVRNRSLALPIALLVLTGCATAPVGVVRASPETVQRQLTASALSGSEPSISARNVLNRLSLSEDFDSDPERVLAQLHELALNGGRKNVHYALAELSFLHAEQSGKREWYFAAAVYAWAYLFGFDAPEPFDPRLRTAADIYNRALAEGMATPDGKFMDVRGGSFPLPFGDLEIAFDPAALDWNGRRLADFVPVAELEVTGLRSRFRSPGIGAPLAVSALPPDPEHVDDFMPVALKIPATAVLVIENVREQIRSGTVRGKLELHTDPDPQTLSIEGHAVPLEREQTATIAAMLSDAPIWKQELQAFLGKLTTIGDEGRLAALRPHHRGRIPVVFVHGTNSNPGRWAEMVDVLEADRRIHDRYEPWFFFYNSGNPIIYSSYLLRKKLTEAVATMDPDGTYPCLHDMVIIGHSQGGLLTKMMAVDSGDRFWRNVSKKPFDDVKMTDEQRERLRPIAFFDHLPFVRRVVFIATPHRGSYLVSRQLIRRLVASLISLPKRLTEISLGLAAIGKDNPEALAADAGSMTAIDNMSPGHRFVKTLAGIPIDPSIKANSIIPVKGTGPIESGNDGVVEYKSAHIEGVESEKVVRSDHSTQSNPETIEEVRRILLEHAAEGCPAR
jgi:pimeloyl-ACP methyl ester carboxylesterase